MKNEKVLITGAGPTGLTMANLLGRLGTPFMLIDKKSQPSRDSKAFGIHARTLEIFGQLGIADKAISAGSIDNTVHIFIKDKERIKLNLREILPGESDYPYFLILQQAKTEKLLIDALEEQGQTVHWEQELVEFDENGEGIKATIKGPGEKKQEYQFQYLIGCDGASSTVREKTGFTFKGKTFSSSFYLADCELEGILTHGDIYFLISPLHISGIFSFKEKGKFRLFNFLNKTVYKDVNAGLSLREVQKIIDSNPYFKLKAKNLEWSSVFKIHTRYAETFQKGRVFLAGDAAHVHSPAGGQGMNTGIQDAYNLAWKMHLVLKGIIDREVLDSYTKERMPIAKNLHNTTDRLFQLMVQKNRLFDIFRQYIFPNIFRILIGFKSFRKNNFRRFSQLAIKYKRSPLNKEGTARGFQSRAPKAGDRAPYCKIESDGKERSLFQLFHYSRFTLLLAGPNPNSKIARQVIAYFENYSHLPLKAYFISKSESGNSFFETYGIMHKAVFIVRPDGHIGFRSSRTDIREIENYFRECLKTNTSSLANS